jgi:hypothetical protein
MQLLTPSNVVPYLLSRRLLAPAAVVDGDVAVVETSRRNRNFRILRGSGEGLFVKQARFEDPVTGPLTCHTVGVEAAVHEVLDDTPELAALHARRLAYDARRHVLVTSLVTGAEDVGQHHRRLGRFPIEVARAIARALAAFHRGALAKATAVAEHAAAAAAAAASPRPNRADTTAADGQRAPTLFAGTVPWMLWLADSTPEAWQGMGGSGGALQSILARQAGLRPALAQLRQSWRLNAFIHGDMRFENCLLTPVAPAEAATTNGAGEPHAHVVDWELADRGDGCWDAAAVLQCYLSAWVMSVPVTAAASSQQMAQMAAVPLASVQPAMRAFWGAYCDSLELDAAARQPALGRAVGYAAVRLIQTAYEHLQFSPGVTPTALCLLQVGLNMLERPARAADVLLGLPS